MNYAAPVATRQLDKDDPFEGLTSFQYKFVQASFSGLNDVEAYRSVTDCSAMNETTIRRKAAETAHMPMVMAKLRQLRERSDEKTTLLPLATKQFVIDQLVHLTLNSQKDSVRLGAVTQLGKVAGIDAFRETTRVEHVTRTAEEVDQELKDLIRSTAQTIEGAAKDVTKPLEPGKRKRSPRS